MVYQEKQNKETNKWEYYTEDLFGEAWIYSTKKLEGETLDELVLDIIMAKGIKKGHTANKEIEFKAKFKPQWKEVYEEDKEAEKEINKTNIKKNMYKKNRIVASLLAFFLGGWGIHKMYLGQVWLGILYLIFCWTFIPSFIAFIEFILLLIMSEEDFDKKYNQ